MKILFEHSGILPVIKYGGTERILFWLMKQLVQEGHEVFLVGHPQSNVSSLGIKLIPKTVDDWRPLIPKGIDLIHLFYTPSFAFDVPVMVTIEGNGRPGEKFIKNTVFVSKKHAEIHGSDQFVYNGLDFDEYPKEKVVKSASWKNFLFLAKASWKVKNLDHCIKACKHAHKHLHIAGGRKWTLNPYIHSYGMVSQDEKIPLLEKVDALLWPVRWHEPFGIAIIEAFAMGKPVIGSSFGSLPELIVPGAGVLCKSYEEFQLAILRKENLFDADFIRHHVEQNFSLKKMAKDYLDCYARILKGESLNPHEPAVKSSSNPEQLLDF